MLVMILKYGIERILSYYGNMQKNTFSSIIAFNDF